MEQASQQPPQQQQQHHQQSTVRRSQRQRQQVQFYGKTTSAQQVEAETDGDDSFSSESYDSQGSDTSSSVVDSDWEEQQQQQQSAKRQRSTMHTQTDANDEGDSDGCDGVSDDDDGQPGSKRRKHQAAWCERGPAKAVILLPDGGKMVKSEVTLSSKGRCRCKIPSTFVRTCFPNLPATVKLLLTLDQEPKSLAEGASGRISAFYCSGGKVCCYLSYDSKVLHDFRGYRTSHFTVNCSSSHLTLHLQSAAAREAESQAVAAAAATSDWYEMKGSCQVVPAQPRCFKQLTLPQSFVHKAFGASRNSSFLIHLSINKDGQIIKNKELSLHLSSRSWRVCISHLQCQLVGCQVVKYRGAAPNYMEVYFSSSDNQAGAAAAAAVTSDGAEQNGLVPTATPTAAAAVPEQHLSLGLTEIVGATGAQASAPAARTAHTPAAALPKANDALGTTACPPNLQQSAHGCGPFKTAAAAAATAQKEQDSNGGGSALMAPVHDCAATGGTAILARAHHDMEHSAAQGSAAARSLGTGPHAANRSSVAAAGQDTSIITHLHLLGSRPAHVKLEPADAAIRQPAAAAAVGAAAADREAALTLPAAASPQTVQHHQYQEGQQRKHQLVLGDAHVVIDLVDSDSEASGLEDGEEQAEGKQVPFPASTPQKCRSAAIKQITKHITAGVQLNTAAAEGAAGAAATAGGIAGTAANANTQDGTPATKKLLDQDITLEPFTNVPHAFEQLVLLLEHISAPEDQMKRLQTAALVMVDADTSCQDVLVFKMQYRFVVYWVKQGKADRALEAVESLLERACSCK